MHKSRFWWVLIGLMALIDIYFFQTIRTVSFSASPTAKAIIYTGFWALSISAILLLILLPNMSAEKQARLAKFKIFPIITGLFFAKLIGSVFFLVDDIRRGVEWTFIHQPKAGISRSFILSWMGIVIGGGLFGVLLYGFSNKYRYQVKKIKLNYDNLPSAFKGLKVVHISDIHSGSFTNKEAVKRGVEKIMRENPDLILFTGDLVNNVADEMKEYMDVFNKLEAPMGVYSTLGNHDYGDYIRWESPDAKRTNLENLTQVHSDLGWRLLMNEHIVLEKDEDKIALIGIENWSSKARFPSYGDLKKAYSGSESYPFKILMSHDPSHWKAEVCELYPDIDLMLAGHTHGAQFGVEISWFRWSPIRHVYKEWAGLYESKPVNGRNSAQKLYINRGFGFIGYPGRVGILPEITVLELS